MMSCQLSQAILIILLRKKLARKKVKLRETDTGLNQPLPPRKPSGRVLALSAGGPGFNPQSRTASYQRRYKNGTSSALEH